MDGKAAPGLRGTPPDAVVFGSKVPVRARYLHIIIWNGYEIVGKARSPLGIPQRRMPGRAAHGRNHAGERLACCIVFFPAILWCVPPLFGGDRFSVPRRRSYSIRLGYRDGRSPPVFMLRQQAGRAIFYRIIFFIMLILYHGKKLRNASLQCAIRCNRMLRIVIKKVITQWNCEKKIPPRFRTRRDLEPKALTKGRKRGVAVYSSKDFRRSRGKA